MRDFLKNVALMFVVALVVVIGYSALVGGNSQPVSPAPDTSTGAATPGTRFPHGVTIGLGGSTNSPTNLALYESGTCTLQVNASIGATSTAPYDCPVTDVVSGDVVTLQLAPTTTIASQYVIKSASASTTAGHIHTILLNLTGQAATPAATNGFGSSTVYQIWRAQ